MKKTLLGVAASLLLFQVAAADLNWMTDLNKAQEKAKSENKIVMVDFTGSDWCPWCIKLNKEIFSTKEFQQYAAKNLVPVEIDFPHKKAQSADLKNTNRALQQKYNIQGYPTVIVLNADGKKLGELGYMEGGPKAFIAELEKLKSGKSAS